jgi:hypothetical protein
MGFAGEVDPQAYAQQVLLNAGSDPNISNIIFWNNSYSDLFGCQLRYSRIDEAGAGRGNINDDPFFVDPENGDYRLRSNRGRYWPEHDVWILDDLRSPCIDAGDPDAVPLDEPAPNGGRINMGAYGGTAQASLSMYEETSLPGQAFNPSPADGAVEVDNTDVILSWSPGANAVSHDVYLGTNESDLKRDRIFLGEGWFHIWEGHQTETEFDPDWLQPNTTYFWRVDEVNSNGTRTGEVWRFTTIEGLAPPPKGRTCFTSETGVWVNGALVSISSVGPRQCVGRIDKAPVKNSSLPLPYLGEVQKLQEHEGVFNCYDVLLQSGNSISVAGNHFFLTESGNWAAVQNLKPSIKLQTPNGLIGIVNVTKRPVPYVGKVYNLKVEGSDRYLVGKDAVIVRDY